MAPVSPPFMSPVPSRGREPPAIDRRGEMLSPEPSPVAEESIQRSADTLLPLNPHSVVLDQELVAAAMRDIEKNWGAGWRRALELHCPGISVPETLGSYMVHWLRALSFCEPVLKNVFALFNRSLLRKADPDGKPERTPLQASDVRSALHVYICDDTGRCPSAAVLAGPSASPATRPLSAKRPPEDDPRPLLDPEDLMELAPNSRAHELPHVPKRARSDSPDRVSSASSTLFSSEPSTDGEEDELDDWHAAAPKILEPKTMQELLDMKLSDLVDGGAFNLGTIVKNLSGRATTVWRSMRGDYENLRMQAVANSRALEKVQNQVRSLETEVSGREQYLERCRDGLNRCADYLCELSNRDYSDYSPDLPGPPLPPSGGGSRTARLFYPGSNRLQSAALIIHYKMGAEQTTIQHIQDEQLKSLLQQANSLVAETSQIDHDRKVLSAKWALLNPFVHECSKTWPTLMPGQTRTPTLGFGGAEDGSPHGQ